LGWGNFQITFNPSDKHLLIGVIVPAEQLQLDDNSRVGVIGGGPAGSFVSIFLLDMANRMGINIEVDIYEPRNFSKSGPAGCNMCGGIISESLVQMLATEGINLPSSVVQRGIDSYMLHTDVGKVLIETPLHEKRIGAVHRGSGPRNVKEFPWESFDGHLQELAIKQGTKIINKRVDQVTLSNGKPQIHVRKQDPTEYDLVVTATGVNAVTGRIFKDADIKYSPPTTTKTHIREYYLGAEKIEKHMGTSMHVFLLDLPRLEFAAIIPKGDYVSLCLLGEDIDKDLLNTFLNTPVVRDCLPDFLDIEAPSCWCSPRINTAGASHPYSDRLLFIGDCGVTRLYKDGIGAAYRLSKAAASTAVFQGISSEEFENYFFPACKSIENDNSIGKLIFLFTQQIQKRTFARRAVLKMVAREQKKPGSKRHMSTILWDMFTGSSPYREIFLRTLHPGFWGRFILDLISSLVPRSVK
jgi:flavin-dependent dehydrogenase